MMYKTIPEMFVDLTDKYQDSKTAFKYKEKGLWIELNYSQLRNKVECLAIGLMELGIHKNDRVGLVSENRIEWILACLAINSIGAVDVPVFPILSAKQEEYIFADCEASAIIVSNNFQLRKVLEFKEKLHSLRHIIVMNKDFEKNDVFIKSLEEVEKRGGELRSEKERKDLYLKSVAKLKSDDLLTVIYTSGTTGVPKGVMLTHQNVSSNIHGCWDFIGDLTVHESISFLPFCHAYERTGGFLALMLGGTTIAIAESVESVAANIGEVNPTMITTVPRLPETIKKKIFAQIEKESITKRKVFNWALNVGLKYVRNQQKGKNSIFINTQYKIADNLVFNQIREKLGGRLRLIVSGGASLSEEVHEFFMAAGITVLQGYGLTETSPVVAANRHDDIEFGTVGKALYHTEIKLANDGEILVKGPGVMKGYWKDNDATKIAIDDEGWLYTGDIGEFTDKGNLKITDRKKNMFVSSGGKNIAPQPIETLLMQSKYIEHVVLIGDKREFITALITPDFNNLRELAIEFEIDFKNDDELISNEKIIKHIKSEIDHYQKDYAKYERVRKFQLLSRPFSVDSGELSPKMSIKRHVVERKYSDLIENMYK